MAFPVFVQDPDDTLDYLVDWAALPSAGGPCLVTGETIATVVWVIPSGLTQVAGKTSNTPTTATVWIQGGTLNFDYLVTCRVTTTAGRVYDRSMTLQIRQQ